MSNDESNIRHSCEFISYLQQECLNNNLLAFQSIVSSGLVHYVHVLKEIAAFAFQNEKLDIYHFIRNELVRHGKDFTCYDVFYFFKYWKFSKMLLDINDLSDFDPHIFLHQSPPENQRFTYFTCFIYFTNELASNKQYSEYEQYKSIIVAFINKFFGNIDNHDDDGFLNTFLAEGFRAAVDSKNYQCCKMWLQILDLQDEVYIEFFEELVNLGFYDLAKMSYEMVDTITCCGYNLNLIPFLNYCLATKTKEEFETFIPYYERMIILKISIEKRVKKIEMFEKLFNTEIMTRFNMFDINCTNLISQYLPFE